MAEHQQVTAQYRHDLAAMQHRAESAEADLMAIRQEVAGWAAVRSRENSELQETRAKLAETSTDLGVALQKAAACGRQVRLNNSSRAGSNRSGSACAAGASSEHARGAATVSPAKGGGQKAHLGPQKLNSDHSTGLQPQQLPVEVVRQLNWQAAETLRLQNLVHELQQRLQGAEQHLASSQAELCNTRKQLEAAEDAVAWHQRQQQGRDEAAAATSVQLQQQQTVEQLERELSAADGQIAELTSQLSAARAEVILQQRKHTAEVRLLQDLQEQLAAAEAAALEAQQLLHELHGLQLEHQGRCRPQQQQPQRRRRQRDQGGEVVRSQLGRNGSGSRETRCTYSAAAVPAAAAVVKEPQMEQSSKHHTIARPLPQSLPPLPQQKQQQAAAGAEAKVASLCARPSGGFAVAADQLAHAAEVYAALVAGNPTKQEHTYKKHKLPLVLLSRRAAVGTMPGLQGEMGHLLLSLPRQHVSLLQMMKVISVARSQAGKAV